jgi:hypothetical protein
MIWVFPSIDRDRHLAAGGGWIAYTSQPTPAGSRTPKTILSYMLIYCLRLASVDTSSSMTWKRHEEILGFQQRLNMMSMLIGALNSTSIT